MVDVPHAPVLAILTRAPSAGGKTRLFGALGRPPDAALLSALLLDTLEAVAVAGVRVVVSVAPASGCDEVQRLLPPGVQVMPQPEGDLGARMRGTMRALLDAGAGAVALVGSDLPGITADRVVDTFRLLAEHPDALVLGPAPDGGYYLLAATRLPPVFDGVPWGSRTVLDDTRREAAGAGWAVLLLDPVDDVDTVDDLRRLLASGAPAPRTSAWARANGLDRP